MNRLDAAALAALQRSGFVAVERNATYGTYLQMLHGVATTLSKSILEIEMFLFAQANDLYTEALPLAMAISALKTS